jgi:hypothetical protein
MPPKISKHGGPSFEDGREPEFIQIKRASLMPGATDKKGGERSSHGGNSGPSPRSDGANETSESPDPLKPAPTTESPSSKTQTETSDVDSMDGSIHGTETESDEGFGDEFDPNETPVEKPAKATKRAPRVRHTTSDFD